MENTLYLGPSIANIGARSPADYFTSITNGLDGAGNDLNSKISYHQECLPFNL